MPTREQITTFEVDDPPPGLSPYVPGTVSLARPEVVDPDPAWPARYAELERRIRDALGWRALSIEHVGSTSVAGLAAKPQIDVDVVVADPDDEDGWVPQLEAAGFELRIREPWWGGHRMVRDGASCNVHVFGPDSAEPWRHRLLRDWLRGHPDDRERYAEVKRAASAASLAAGEHVMAYNARKEHVIREIYARAFVAAGLLDPS